MGIRDKLRAARDAIDREFNPGKFENPKAPSSQEEDNEHIIQLQRGIGLIGCSGVEDPHTFTPSEGTPAVEED